MDVNQMLSDLFQSDFHLFPLQPGSVVGQRGLLVLGECIILSCDVFLLSTLRDSVCGHSGGSFTPVC